MRHDPTSIVEETVQMNDTRGDDNCFTEEDEVIHSFLKYGRLRLPDVEPYQMLIPAPVESPATVKRHMDYAIKARASYYGDL